jgi:NTP pyrophosphatase (non-canonical NTP hydrolase)
MKQRYEKECISLGEMANEALNLPKNIGKPNFEILNLNTIYHLLDEEVQEIKYELFHNGQINNPKDIHEIDFKRAKEELADCAAVLTGLLSWINKQEEILPATHKI